jgi:hypothetical protein
MMMANDPPGLNLLRQVSIIHSSVMYTMYLTFVNFLSRVDRKKEKKKIINFFCVGGKVAGGAISLSAPAPAPPSLLHGTFDLSLWGWGTCSAAAANPLDSRLAKIRKNK